MWNNHNRMIANKCYVQSIREEKNYPRPPNGNNYASEAEK